MNKEIMVTTMQDATGLSLVKNEQFLEEMTVQKWLKQNIKKFKPITLYRNINVWMPMEK